MPWSIARVPDPSQSFSGVYFVIVGSRMMLRGIIIG